MTANEDTAIERLRILLGDAGLEGRTGAASVDELARANGVAPVPEPLAALYLAVDEFRFGEVSPFAPEDYIEVNEAREAFGEVANGIFVASDLADGWFFVDPTGFMGLGPGFVFWVERGRFVADDCVPAAESLIDLFEVAAAGHRPWQAPMLGDRALDRLIEKLDASASVATRTPVDPELFHARGQIPLPLRLGQLLLKTNGFLLLDTRRQFFGLERIEAVDGSGEDAGLPGALWIGEEPGGRRLAMTSDIDWLGLPGERMLAVEPGQPPESGALLGRVWDVWSRWIDGEDA